MRSILLGPPGGGKGTVAKRLQAEFNIPVISTGVILREAVDKKSKLGIEVENIMRKGGLLRGDGTNLQKWLKKEYSQPVNKVE